MFFDFYSNVQVFWRLAGGVVDKINHKCCLSACYSYAVTQCMATVKSSHCSVLKLGLYRTCSCLLALWNLFWIRTKKKVRLGYLLFFPLSFPFLFPEGLYFLPSKTHSRISGTVSPTGEWMVQLVITNIVHRCSERW